jgi:hypothetical protein
MKLRLNQYMVSLILAFLVLSCAGGSLGMLLHGEMTMYGTINTPQTETFLSCCGLEEKENTNQQPQSSTHHTIIISILTDSSLFYLSLLVTVIVVSAYTYTITRHDILWRYFISVRRRWGSFSFFCRQIKLLFSRGILHPQVW